jgi:tetratricopeptide (TPR) repeat protein
VVFRFRALLAGITVLLGVSFAYSNHFHNGFQFDDHHSITNNVAIRSLSNFATFFADVKTSSVFPTHESWRPLVTASLALDYWLGKGYNTFYFHLSTFLWFLTMLIFLASLFQAILDRVESNASNLWIAWFAAAWYGLHPAMAETVNYIIQRADVMSTWGVVAGMAIYARFPAWRGRGFYLLPVAIGLLCKAPALIFPAILAAYILLFEEGASHSSRARILPRVAPALGLSVVFLILQSVMTPKSFAPGSISAYRYLITQPYVWFRYFVSFFLPVHLSADTDLRPLESAFSLEAFGGFVFVAFLLFSIYLTAKRPTGRPVAFGLTWFVLGLIPTSVFPLAEVENDHRMFLPFAGLVLAVTCAGAWIAKRQLSDRPARAAITAAAICILVLCAAGTHRRNEIWRTEETLWRDVTLKSPQNGRGLMNYGLARMSAGDFQGALTYFERALQYTPNYPQLQINLAIDTGALGRDAEAEQHFRRALQLAPNDADSHFFYGRWLDGRGRGAEATAELREAVRLNPTRMDARVLLLKAYAGQREWALLTPLAAETLRLAPDDPTARSFAELKADQAPAVASRPATPPGPETLLNLSLAAYQKSDFEGCIRFAQLALKQRPEYAEAYNNLVAAYNSLGRWDQAIQAGREALRIRPDYQLARNNVRWAESQKSRLAMKNASRAAIP